MSLFYSFTTIIGKLLQKIIPSCLVVPIFYGSLRGKKWVIGSSNLECALGTYEYRKHIMFEQEVIYGDIVYDIGAHAGFYTLLASVLVGNDGKVVSFEPSPQNFHFLKNHIEMNKCKNVVLNRVAVADFLGISHFQEGESNYTGHLANDGEISVETITLDTFIKNNQDLIPDCLKIDVEGAEFSVLNGSEFIISNYHPKIFLATHNEVVHRKCIDFLLDHNYAIENINNQNNEIFAIKKEF